MDQGWRRRKLLAKDGGEEVLSCIASPPFCFGFTSSLVPKPVCRTLANKVAVDVCTG